MTRNGYSESDMFRKDGENCMIFRKDQNRFRFILKENSVLDIYL